MLETGLRFEGCGFAVRAKRWLPAGRKSEFNEARGAAERGQLITSDKFSLPVIAFGLPEGADGCGYVEDGHAVNGSGFEGVQNFRITAAQKN
jgi:hypothetical protein